MSLCSLLFLSRISGQIIRILFAILSTSLWFPQDASQKAKFLPFLGWINFGFFFLPTDNSPLDLAALPFTARESELKSLEEQETEEEWRYLLPEKRDATHGFQKKNENNIFFLLKNCQMKKKFV